MNYKQSIGIKKYSPEGEESDFAPQGSERNRLWNSLKFGPDSTIYATKHSNEAFGK